MAEPIYIDEHQNILQGEAARTALEKKSDAAYLVPGQGVVKVPDVRWKEAQTFEKQHWMERQLMSLDDRNHDHARLFDDYCILRGRQFNSAIELGCGPFTNLRLIATACIIKQASLLDPLIPSYLEHPHCRYSPRELRVETSLSRKLNRKGFRRIRNALLALRFPGFSESLPVSEVMPYAIEQLCGHDDQFDLIVMINVIEHCYDIDRIFANILKIARKQAIFVFHDKYYHHTQIALQLSQELYDAGHPLHVDRSIIDKFITENFEPLFRKEVRNSYLFNGQDMSYDSVYFIGSLKRV